ncbi:hypothetical protein BLNAU_24456 [Blattamonas nauphoetae]|uniref:Uncharacterized protein n=2 Tax=Blattamonas nauphoetae TaxID=2049346 RepID=A0ABQ9WMF1_9EUKA|nr:hypothetical protein BLNAU_24456 [Blattamonas nauphoetae]
MLPENPQNISKTNKKDETSKMESVLEWLSDSSVHPRYKVNSFQWFHIPSLLTTHIQSQQEQPTKQTNELLSQLLQRMMTILDECFDCHTPIANKRLLHSSLSQLSQLPSLDPKIKKGVGYCFVALDSVDEGPFVLVWKEEVESNEAAVSSFSNLQQKHDEIQAKLSERDIRIATFQRVILVLTLHIVILMVVISSHTNQFFNLGWLLHKTCLERHSSSVHQI